MRKGICYITLLIGFIFIPLQVVAQFAGGSGTLGDPYHVATAAQLNEVRNNLTSHFIQTADIDLGGDDSDGDYYNGGFGWTPIGTSSNEFIGTYDGGSFTISGLYINRFGSYDNYGLFGYVENDGDTLNNGILKNINLEEVDVLANNNVGGLVGWINGTISNCSVSGSVSGTSSVGGLAGTAWSATKILESNSSASASGSGSIGGLAGTMYKKIARSFATGSVSGGTGPAGGLVGSKQSGDVIKSYASGSVSGSSTNGGIGGLIGTNEDTVLNSYSTGMVNGTGNDVGGLIGKGPTPEIYIVNSYWNTESSGQATSEGGTGLTESQMKQQASFNNWNFSTIWAIDEGVSYPYLINNPPIIPLDAPVLVYPGDEATGLEDSVTLAWNSVPNADSYTLERAEADDFSNVGEYYLLQEDLTDTTHFIGHLTPSVTIYWRVKTAANGQESEWSEVFSFTSSENSSMPDDIVLISPPDLAENQPLEITFTWHSDKFAEEYEFQLDETDSFESPVATYANTDTTFTTGSLTPATTYYWRVRGKSEYGEIFWADAFSFTTEIGPPSSPGLLFPENGATGLEDSVTVIWHSVENADSYTFEGSEIEDFSDPNNVFEDGLTDTTLFLPELPPNRQLYWRVKTVTGGTESDWSETFSFTTSPNSLMPDPITLISPINMAENLFLNVTLRWHSDEYADEYQIQVDTLDGFLSPIVDMIKADTNTTTGILDEGTTYYWRVRGVNGYGEAEWSQIFSFTTEETPPSPPELLYPGNGATGLEDTLTIRWGSVEGADSYTLETSDAEDFNSESNFLIEGIEDTTFFGESLPPSVTFYWRVKAIVEEKESEWSEVSNFTTSENSAKPESISLISPADMAEELPIEITFIWHSDIFAEEYQIRIGENEELTSIVFNSSVEDTTVIVTDGFVAGTTYYWRVRGTNVYQEGDWSEIFSFTITEDPLDAPQLVYPQNGATELEDTVTAVWHPVEEAVSYKFEGSEADDFDNPENYYVEGITDTTLFIPELPPARQLYWRVKAVAESKESAWSETFSFTTTPGSSFPDSIKLISPADMETGKPVELTFTWHSDSDADEYQFQLDIQDSFTSPNVDSTTFDTTLTPETLAEGTVYYWRVRGINQYGEASWSQVFSFTTVESHASVPVLISPEDEATGLQDSVVFVWHSLPDVLSFELQGSYVNDFSEGGFGADLLIDTTLTVHIFPPDSLFYWRVRGVFEEGPGEWSQVWSFTTSPTSSFPEIPVLHLPENEAMDMELSLNLQWFPDIKLERYGLDVSYEVEISTDETFEVAEATFEVDQDTVAVVEDLQENTQYFWRIRGNNEYGTGEWSEVWSFTTKMLTSAETESGIPTELALLQNYPNPFNPSTVIRYDLPVPGIVDLRVFDLLGREVAALVEGATKPAGRHSVTFDAGNLASGMYIYQLKAGNNVLTNRMILMK